MVWALLGLSWGLPGAFLESGWGVFGLFLGLVWAPSNRYARSVPKPKFEALVLGSLGALLGLSRGLLGVMLVYAWVLLVAIFGA